MLSYEVTACVLERAQLALEAGNFEMAVALTEEILEQAETLPEIWLVRARALAHLGRVLEAVESARQYAAAKSEDPEAQLELASIAWRAGRLSLAQQAFEKAVILTRADPAIFAEYAWFMAFERGPRPAEAVARQAVDIAPNSSTAWAALGLALLRLHRRKEAEEALARALKLDPNDPSAQCAMLFLLKEERKNEKALALARILDDTPEATSIVHGVRRELKRRLIAQKLVERGVQFSPRNPPNWIRPVLWTANAMIGLWLVFVFQAQDFWSVGACLGLPLVLAWILDRLLTD